MARISKAQLTVTLAAVAVLIVAARRETQIPETEMTVSAASEVVEAAPPIVGITDAIETEPEPPWSDEEVHAIARTLAGECYDDKENDKRLVCEVILNRVSDSRWGNTVLEVLEQEDQFLGYWSQGREISENDIEVAETALADWYANDCNALSEYLYFCSGDNRENVFRSEF